MIRNIIHNFLLVRTRPLFKLHRSNAILPRVTSSTPQHSFAAYATSPSLAQEFNKWEKSLDNETRSRLFEIKVEVSYYRNSGKALNTSQNIFSWDRYSKRAKESVILMCWLLSNGKISSHCHRWMPGKRSTIGSVERHVGDRKTRYDLGQYNIN